MFPSNFRILTAITLMTLSVPAFAEHGNGGSGGGEAILCYKSMKTLNAVYDELKAIEEKSKNEKDSGLMAADLRLSELSRRPEMRDLFEATRPTGIPQAGKSAAIPKPLAVSADKIYAAIGRIDPKFMELFSPSISDGSQWKGHEGVLKLRDSSTSYLFSKGCMKVQMASYDDASKIIYYNSNITALMDQPNLTALKVHEDFYRFYREGVRSQKSELKRSSYYLRTSSLETQQWAERASALKMTSDPVRPLTAYVLTQNMLIKKDFVELAKNVAIGVHFRTRPFCADAIINDYVAPGLESVAATVHR